MFTARGGERRDGALVPEVETCFARESAHEGGKESARTLARKSAPRRVGRSSPLEFIGKIIYIEAFRGQKWLIPGVGARPAKECPAF